MSSFSGKIKEFPQISVDRYDGRNLASTAYFLSHAHSDHMIGLSSPHFLDHLESNGGVYLYCSQITARFLQASIRHRPLSPYIFPLPLEELVKITVPNVAEEATHQLWVTLIPAAHCPGSVMFLFEGRGGTVLYTGDFRIHVGDVARLSPLHNGDGTVKGIDSLLIDTTFCHRDIMQFPSRDESTQAIAETIEDWLARGNNYLIHLICPAKYGYEYIYRSLHDRFGMKIHVSRWKYNMYDTVPEIQEVLTLNTTRTWIHSCDYRVKNGEESITEISRNRQLPCRCVPFGVDTAPHIRVIKPSAMFYTHYQSAKEIKQISSDGTFCRVLLSMHASCSEVLDMVSYLRPRKVFPNVIPSNSTKEEVLKLLHEALNQSGDHYSIEYGGNQHSSLGSFKRQLQSTESSCNGSSTSSTSSHSILLDGGLLDVYLSSPNKRRRYSDSNMTLLLPTPRGNMKGSLSLEGEMRHLIQDNDSSQPSTSLTALKRSPKLSHLDSVVDIGEELDWNDPYTPSSPGSLKNHHFFENSVETCLAETDGAPLQNLSIEFNNVKDGKSPVKSSVEWGCSINERKLCSSSDIRDSQSLATRKSTSTMGNVDEVDDETSSVPGFMKLDGSQDGSFELSSSVFSEAGDHEDPLTDFENNSRASSVASVIAAPSESAIKQSRKMWYKHKYFSTPVHDEMDKTLKRQALCGVLDVKPCMGPRSSSLPLPKSCRGAVMSTTFFNSTDIEENLPLITVSSPSETQISNETEVAIALSSSDPSDSSTISSNDHSECVDGPFGDSENKGNSSSSSLRPSVIRCPPKSEGGVVLVEVDEGSDREELKSFGNKSASSKDNAAGRFKSHDSGWISCSKKTNPVVKEQNDKALYGKETLPSSSSVKKEDFDSIIVKRSKSDLSTPDVIDLVSNDDCSPEFIYSGSSKETPDSLRSSCLKTVRRTQDHVEVISLEHTPL